ncbi:MAG: hypothetical protein KOO63_16870 [Bacteroidales bacterium]|nr:hypothetical protein [Candidatus Latescibacterota bacterium]
MKNMLIVIIVGLVISPLALSAQEQIEAFGAGYFTAPEASGTLVTTVAFLEPPVGFSYPFPVDFVNYEYTLYFQTTIASVVSNIPFSIDYYYDDGDFFIYEDPLKDGDYGVTPPNATAPSTFQNGTLILQGTLTNLERYDDPFGFMPPVMVADCTFTGGSRLGDLAAPNPWIMHGGMDITPGTYPSGYQQAWTMKFFFTGTVGAENSTWGAIKALIK